MWYVGIKAQWESSDLSHANATSLHSGHGWFLKSGCDKTGFEDAPCLARWLSFECRIGLHGYTHGTRTPQNASHQNFWQHSKILLYGNVASNNMVQPFRNQPSSSDRAYHYGCSNHPPWDPVAGLRSRERQREQLENLEAQCHYYSETRPLRLSNARQ